VATETKQRTLKTRRPATAKPSGSSRQALKPILAPSLKRLPWLFHGFSTRNGGASSCYGGHSLNLGFTQHDKRANVEQNRQRLLAELATNQDKGRKAGKSGAKPYQMVTLRQIHSDLIHVITKPAAKPLAGDGMITNAPGIALGVQTADCFPVLLVDTKSKAVGAFHAGWRGTVARIAVKGLGLMRHEFGTLPQDVIAAIGPGIQECCYEVGEELKANFESQFEYASELFRNSQESDVVRERYPMLFMNQRAPGHGDMCLKLFLDLREANRRQLIAAGVPEENITALKDCTSCDPKRFFSYRAERGTTGRMLAVVGIRHVEARKKSS
jgi:purine-nucleoside/S-methyl-5'-thioadenosine phosphorylase / adenosine deaminase